MDFRPVRAVISDIDGVLWRGGQGLPGLTAFFELLAEREIPIVLATNNSSKHPRDYVRLFAALGVPGLAEHQIVTSSTATAAYLAAHFAAGTPVHVLGMAGLKEAVASAGMALVEEGAAVVVAGIDFDLTYARARQAALQIRAGAAFIGANGDVTFPTPEGLVPGAGSILALLEAAAGVAPIIIGKPAAPMFEEALRRLGTTAGATLMLGDRMNTDIAGAQACGIRTALVLSGVTTEAELAEAAVRPDGVFSDLDHLTSAWRSG
jgi:4-nitrophenyl phosphatase